MSRYEPDGWVVVKIPEGYKIFGEWRGSYTSGDAWRMNSGIQEVVEWADHFDVIGYSGSVYKCYKHLYGIRGMYCQGVIADLCKKLPEIEPVDTQKRAVAILEEFK